MSAGIYDVQSNPREATDQWAVLWKTFGSDYVRTGYTSNKKPLALLADVSISAKLEPATPAKAEEAVNETVVRGKHPIRYALTGYNELEGKGAKVAWGLAYFFLGGIVLTPLKSLLKLFFEALPLQLFSNFRDLAKSAFEKANTSRSRGGMLGWGLLGVLAAIPAACMAVLHFFTRSLLSPISAAKEAYEFGEKKSAALGVMLAGVRLALSLGLIIVGVVFAVPIAIGAIAQAGSLAGAVELLTALSNLPMIAKLQSFFGLLASAVQAIVPIATAAAVAATAFWATITATALTLGKMVIDWLSKPGLSDTTRKQLKEFAQAANDITYMSSERLARLGERMNGSSSSVATEGAAHSHHLFNRRDQSVSAAAAPSSPPPPSSLPGKNY